MRKCSNCYNGHYNLSERGEELYCDEIEFVEELVKDDDCCEDHIYIPGMEEEKNYIVYDESYIAPGYMIVNIKDGKICKFLKIYTIRGKELPFFGISAYSSEAVVTPGGRSMSMDFSFRDIEDYENGLYNCFCDLADDLLDEKILSIDSTTQGRSSIKVDVKYRVTKLILSKYITKNSSSIDFIDISIGNNKNCINYDIVMKLYIALSKMCTDEVKFDDNKKLVLTKRYELS